MSNEWENHEPETQENLEDADIDLTTQDDEEPLGTPEELDEVLEEDDYVELIDPAIERLVEETEKGWHGRTASRQRLSLGSHYDAVMARINKA